MRTKTTIIIMAAAISAISAAGCVDKDFVFADEGGCTDEADETDGAGLEADPCEDLPADWPGEDQVAVRVLSCEELPGDTRRYTCAVAVYLEDGHAGDFALESSGAGVLPWNAYPWNADAGDLEDAELVGAGVMCGSIAVNTSTISTWNGDGQRFFDVVISDDTAGLFTLDRVFLD